MNLITIRICVLSMAAIVGQVTAQPCSPAWSPLSGGTTGGAGTQGVFALAVFDNGTGPALYVGGNFEFAGGQPITGLARWDGTRWAAINPNFEGQVFSLAVYDSGSGPHLYVASASGAVYRLDGNTFVDTNAPGFTVLFVWDDGTGPALYAGGPTASSNGIGKWNGSSWLQVGGGVSNGYATAFGIYDDDGPGPHAPALYVGGSFDHAGGVAANGIAKWDGTSWSALGAGLLGVSPDFRPQPHSMAVFNDGTGSQLYVSGYFATAGGQPAKGIARWNGTTWSSNFGATFDFDSAWAMQVFDDGRGPALWLAGTGNNSGVFGTNYGIARWDGVSWTNPNTTTVGNIGGRALAIYDSGSGPGLYFGGAFSSLNGVSANNIARWGRPMCPANCDGSFNAAGCPTLNASDFNCFINRFAAGDIRANCDGTTTAPVLTCNDFMCFMNKFAAGCS